MLGQGKQRYVCVHCMLVKDVPGGCRCVSPFAGEHSWISMREELDKQTCFSRITASFSTLADSISDMLDHVLWYGDSMGRLTDVFRSPPRSQSRHNIWYGDEDDT